MGMSREVGSLEECIKAAQAAITKNMAELENDPVAMSALSLHRAMIPAWTTWLKEESSGKGVEVVHSTCYLVACLMTEVIVNIAKDGSQQKLAASMCENVIRQIQDDLKNLEDAYPIPGFRKTSQ